MFGLVPSLIVAAAGAVLLWAVNVTVSGVNIHTIGWILLIVGAIGFLLSLAFWSSLSPRGYYRNGPPDDPYIR